MAITTATGIIRLWRDVPPAHYTFRVESFSLFVSNKIDHCETCMFESCGYKWKISLHPNGNKKRKVTDHISLYLAIADTDALPSDWMVNVTYKFFLYNHISHKYLTFQAAEEVTTRLYMLNTEVGIDELIPLATLNDFSNGFLLEDSCIFGAEVFVIKFSGHGECISMLKDPPHNTFTWKLPNFSQITGLTVYSDEFGVGGYKWKLFLYPKGEGISEGEHISLYLELLDDLPSARKVLTSFILRVRGNSSSIVNGEEGEANEFCSSNKSWGYRNFCSLKDLNNQPNSKLVNDTLTIETQITLVSKHKRF